MNIDDTLEESRLFQEIAKKEQEKELHNMLIHLTTLRFPNLLDLAQKQAERAKSPEQLRTIIDKLVTAPTEQEARDALMS